MSCQLRWPVAHFVSARHFHIVALVRASLEPSHAAATSTEWLRGALKWTFTCQQIAVNGDLDAPRKPLDMACYEIASPFKDAISNRLEELVRLGLQACRSSCLPFRTAFLILFAALRILGVIAKSFTAKTSRWRWSLLRCGLALHSAGKRR